MTSRLSKARPRRAPLRSSVDVWSIQQPYDASLSPPSLETTFPTVIHAPGIPPAPAATQLSSYPTTTFTSTKLPPSSYVSPIYGVDAGLDWRESEKKGPARRRKDAEREVLASQAAVGALFIITLIAGILFVFSRMGPETPTTRQPPRAERSAKTGGLRSALGGKVPSFRDNLDASMRYVTSPQHGSLAHQTMSLYHLTYLAGILDRTPLIPPFYIPPAGTRSRLLVPASQVFDFDKFKNDVNVTGMDWTDVRPQSETAKLEQLGCWTASVADAGELAERTSLMQDIGLDPSFYPLRVPTLPAKPHEIANDLQSAYSFLSAFDGDQSAKDGLIDQAVHTSSVATPSKNPHREPEQHLFCVDHTLFHTASVTAHLDQYEHTAFRAHGQQLRFTRELEDAGADVVAFVLGHRGPFVGVHIASADCIKRDGESGPCTYSLLKYMASVERVRVLAGAAAGRKTTREQRHQIRALNVLVSTDVTDIGFLGEIVNLGWSLLDHSDGEIRQRYGAHAPDIIESVVHSRAAAFVGTKDCSESKLAALRVRAWRNGPVELV